MQRLSTLARSTGGIQRRLLRPGGEEMRRVIEVSNGLRYHHSKGKSPPSGEHVSCSHDKQYKLHHSGLDGRTIYPPLDRQLLYEGEGEGEGESENDATEDTSTVCTGCYLSPFSLSLLYIHCASINSAYCVMLYSLRNILSGNTGNWTTSCKIIERE